MKPSHPTLLILIFAFAALAACSPPQALPDDAVIATQVAATLSAYQPPASDTQPVLPDSDTPAAPASSPPASATPTDVPISTPSAEMDEHSSGPGTLLTYSDCFDLDQGLTGSGNDPVCDFVALPGPDGDSLLLEFSPLNGAAFGFSGVFLSPPPLEACAGSNALSSGVEIINPLGYYVPFRTNTGRYGYILIHSMDASTGITFEWTTYPPAVRPTATPAAISASDLIIPFGTCLDLDNGVLGSSRSCDILFQPGAAGDGFTIRAIPQNSATFAFGGVFTGPPDASTCLHASTLSAAEEDIAIQGFYVCYQTSQSYSGYIHVTAYDAVNGVTLDWMTYSGAN